MIITRISKLTGKEHSMDLPIEESQLIDFAKGTTVQDAFPNLTPEQREFFLTGITPLEWDTLIAITEDDDDIDFVDDDYDDDTDDE